MQLPIKAILVFHAAARAGSIARAAEELSVTPSAVSQQIQVLEVQLGVALLTKAGRGIALTEAGERYFSMISGQMESIEQATATLRGFRSVTTLTVRATPTLSNKWLLPRLGHFLDRHPDLELRLDGTNEPTDFNQELVDIELRHGDGRWPGLYVESIAEEQFYPVCSPDYAAANSLRPEEVLGHRLIHSVKSQAQWNSWFPLAGVTPEERWPRVLFDRSHMAIDAAVRGMGIALESTLMMDEELQRGRLICPVISPPEVRISTQWIVCPRDHLRQKKVRLFLEWLRTERDIWQAAYPSGAIPR
ncbi:LysR family transcriptional regulator [Rhizobium sp. PP-F2F-G38]|uniref:LysR family transcriptional regulator n=1 Tax=Ferranicluibacter rubi TaxID=2715133 RepID=A0AA43ZFV7_9HYPH|nr:LysR substrate-binding domain-containing protein [Ferranicluibacter rubi]NHT77083.1 LysR family transcriptional regulator [Ferranicluibacter rubi]PYE31427.1 LysR family transcriptional regulator [Rhizobium sp. PP-WC-1G-195]PYE93990.1 LysR family transcriptional regulator [Rhizobium sp. PP-F2F-G38]TCQ20135.1 LysR family transcriptional regulator [Rhizobium sp. PP-CC-3G-465]